MSILDIDYNIQDDTEIIRDWLSNNIHNVDFDNIEIKNNIINSSKSIFLKPNGNLPPYIKFGKIEGDFNCSNCWLTTLRGTPDYICGDFSCSFNSLKDFTDGPKMVSGSYSAEFIRNLESLKGIPKYLNRLYLNSSPNLLSLENLENVNLSAIYIKNCKQITGAKYIIHIDKIYIQDTDILKQELILMDKEYTEIRSRIKRDYKVNLI